jgi:toxin ParE1/3/4
VNWKSFVPAWPNFHNGDTSPPPELSRINVTAFLEVHFKPYRILYEIDTATVYMHCVLDGRRDLTTLLERRLLR